MNKDLKKRIKEFNKIKYPNDNSKRIIIASLSVKPKRNWGVTTAPKNKEQQAYVTKKPNIPKQHASNIQTAS